jgi:hypothetical protein
MVPVTLDAPLLRVKLVSPTDDAFNASLKVAVTGTLTNTPVAPLAGLVAVTVGATASVAPPPPPPPHADSKVSVKTTSNIEPCVIELMYFILLTPVWCFVLFICMYRAAKSFAMLHMLCGTEDRSYSPFGLVASAKKNAMGRTMAFCVSKSIQPDQSIHHHARPTPVKRAIRPL